jgi:predicted nucleotidyltransferase
LTIFVKTSDVILKTFGEIIRIHRLRLGLPLRKVAASLELDQGLLSKIERGVRMPGREQVYGFASFYGVDADELLVAWLSDRIMYELEGEENVSEVLKVTEQKIAYHRRNADTKSVLIKNCKRVLQNFPAVKTAWIFGSFARGENRPGSDLDILIDVPRTVSFTLFDIAEIKNELSLATGMKADVVLERALKPSVRERVKQDLRLIYEA